MSNNLCFNFRFYQNKTRVFTFCAGLGARRVGPGDAEAILDGGGRARGRDIMCLLMCVYD